MAAVNLVVMIDASHEGEPGELCMRPLPLSAQPSAVGAHYTTPEELAALTAAVYGRCPPVVVSTVSGFVEQTWTRSFASPLSLRLS